MRNEGRLQPLVNARWASRQNLTGLGNGSVDANEPGMTRALKEWFFGSSLTGTGSISMLSESVLRRDIHMVGRGTIRVFPRPKLMPCATLTVDPGQTPSGGFEAD